MSYRSVGVTARDAHGPVSTRVTFDWRAAGDGALHWLLLAEGQLARPRFGTRLRRIAALSLP